MDRCRVFNPFSYLVKTDELLNVFNSVEENPEFFKITEKIINEILMSDQVEQLIKKYRNEIDKIFKAYSIRGEIQALSTRDIISQLEIVLEKNQIFLHLFKEISASLKSNILNPKESVGRIRKDLIRIVEKYYNIITPKAVFRKFTGVYDDYKIHIKGSDEYFKGKCFEVLFKSSRETNPIFIYVITIGAELDEEVKRLSTSSGDVYYAYLLNGVGAGVADLVAYDLQKYLEKRYINEQKYHLIRMSPGYSDWQLSDQKLIFKILKPESTIGVSLLNSNLMVPLKSTSGLMGPVLKEIRGK